MGYCMTMVDSSFRIPAQKKADALAAMKQMDPAKGGGGGFWEGRKQWAWVDQTVVNKAQTLEEAMEEWRYVPELDTEGNIIDVRFKGEKIGDEMKMFKAIAPFVENDSYIEMNGEDGAMWRWVFRDGSVEEITPKVEWE